MDNEKKSRIIHIAALLILALAVIVMSLGLVKGFLTGREANILVGIALFIFWLLSDILEPFACRRFEDITIGMRAAYVKYILLDLAGYAGILYFLAGVGGSQGQSSGLLGAVIYVVSMAPKRKQQRIFMGLESEEEEESQKDDAKEAAQITEQKDSEEEPK